MSTSGPPIPREFIQPSEYSPFGQVGLPDDGRVEKSEDQRRAEQAAKFWPEADIKAKIGDDPFRWLAERGLLGVQLLRAKGSWNPLRSARESIETGRDRETVVAAFAEIHALAARLPLPKRR